MKRTGGILHYHGVTIHELYKSLYIRCHYVAKNESIILFMLDIADWLINLCLNSKVYVIDLEYYCQNILKLFKNRDILVITHAKNYKQLKKAKKE
ncbi:hypothetical protein [Candidatus Harpocratesius sp.]